MTVDSILGMIDRNAISVLKPQLKAEFGLNDSDYALLVTAFMVPFALFYAITGKWVDRYGSRVALTSFVAVWSAATVASGFVQSFPQLLVLRAILGAAEAGLLPASMVALVAWFPRDKLATVYAIKNPLQALGPILTPPVVAFLAINYGWRSAFWVPGALGFLFAWLWWRADRNPPVYTLPPGQAEVATAGPLEAGILAMLRNPVLWGVLLFRLVSDPVWFFFQYWQAGYMQEVLGLSLAAVGGLLWIPPAVNAVTTFISAWFSDRMIRQGRPAVKSRLMVMFVTVGFAPLILILPFTRDTTTVLAIITTTYIMSYTWLYLSNIMIANLVPKNMVGSAVGVVNSVGTAGAALFNLAAGPIIDANGYTPVFIACAVMHPLAALIAWHFYLRPRRASAAQAPVISAPQA